MTLAAWAIGGAVLGWLVHMLFGRMFVPDNYSGRWYDWITNQAAHFSVMFFALLAIVLTLQATGAEIPYRIDMTAGGVAFALAFQVRQWLAGGGWADSLEDAVFMGVHGWTAPIWSFKADQFDSLTFQPEAAAVFLTLAVFHFACGVLARIEWRLW